MPMMQTFFHVYLLPQIFVAIPTTLCKAERVFSGIKRIKSVIRSTVFQDRLNSIMLLHLHADIIIDSKLVVNTTLSTKDWILYRLYTHLLYAHTCRHLLIVITIKVKLATTMWILVICKLCKFHKSVLKCCIFAPFLAKLWKIHGPPSQTIPAPSAAQQPQVMVTIGRTRDARLLFGKIIGNFLHTTSGNISCVSNLTASCRPIPVKA